MSLWYIILFILNYRKGFIMKRPTLHKLIFSILLFAISFLALFTSHKSSAFADWIFFHHLPAFQFRPRTLFWNLPIFCFWNWIVYFCHSSVSFLDPDADQLHLQNACPKKEPCLARLRFLTPASLRMSVYHLYFFLRNQLRTYFICRKISPGIRSVYSGWTDLFMQRTDWSVKCTFWLFRTGFWRSCWYG